MPVATLPVNVSVSVAALPKVEFPSTDKFVPMVKSAANLEDKVAYIPPVVLIDAYVPSDCAATPETTESAESEDPVGVSIVVFAFNTLRFADPASSRHIILSAVFALVP